jgi:hypothetical protein
MIDISLSDYRVASTYMEGVFASAMQKPSYVAAAA